MFSKGKLKYHYRLVLAFYRLHCNGFFYYLFSNIPGGVAYFMICLVRTSLDVLSSIMISFVVYILVATGTPAMKLFAWEFIRDGTKGFSSYNHLSKRNRKVLIIKRPCCLATPIDIIDTSKDSDLKS